MPEAVTPEPVMKVAQGFMASKFLFAASETGLFEKLAQGPATLDEVAARTGLPRRTARILVDAMVALGFAERARIATETLPWPTRSSPAAGRWTCATSCASGTASATRVGRSSRRP